MENLSKNIMSKISSQFHRVKVFLEPGVMATCCYPVECKNGFGEANPKDMLCYGNICTALCKEVKNKKLSWMFF